MSDHQFNQGYDSEFSSSDNSNFSINQSNESKHNTSHLSKTLPENSSTLPSLDKKTSVVVNSKKRNQLNAHLQIEPNHHLSDLAEDFSKRARIFGETTPSSSDSSTVDQSLPDVLSPPQTISDIDSIHIPWCRCVVVPSTAEAGTCAFSTIPSKFCCDPLYDYNPCAAATVCAFLTHVDLLDHAGHLPSSEQKKETDISIAKKSNHHYFFSSSFDFASQSPIAGGNGNQINNNQNYSNQKSTVLRIETFSSRHRYEILNPHSSIVWNQFSISVLRKADSLNLDFKPSIDGFHLKQLQSQAHSWLQIQRARLAFSSSPLSQTSSSSSLSPPCFISTQNSGWQRIRHSGLRPWDTVFLPAKLKNEFLSDFEDFIRFESFFRKRHIPYKRIYTFLGPSGTGKRSLIEATASKTERSLCFIEPRAWQPTSLGVNLLNQLRPDSILVLEHVDRILQSMPFILGSILESVNRIDNIILILTAHNWDNFKDHGLSVGSNRTFRFKCIQKEEAQSMFYHIMPPEFHSEWQTCFSKLSYLHELTPKEFENILISRVCSKSNAQFWSNADSIKLDFTNRQLGYSK